MKYQWRILAAILLWSIQLHAQITIDNTTYPFSSVLGADTLKVATYTSSYPSFVAGENKTWDMSAIVDSTPVFFTYRTALFGYTFADSEQYTFLGYGYNGNIANNISADGYVEIGLDLQHFGYDLLALTPLITDSLIIDSQNIVYSDPRNKIVFPATYGSSWSSDYNYDFNFLLSIATFSYDHAPGYVRTYVKEKDTVSGWGRMRVRNLAGAPSDYWSVLQVRSRIITTDSIYINGSPATILPSLGLAQNSADTVFEENYYRLGEITPLAKVQFRDAAFTQPYKCTTHVQRLSNPDLAVSTLTNQQNVEIYPNPVTNNSFDVTLPLTVEGISYELVNSVGKTILSSKLYGNNGPLHVTMPDNTAPGLYFLRITSKGGSVMVRKIDVVK